MKLRREGGGIANEKRQVSMKFRRRSAKNVGRRFKKSNFLKKNRGDS
jgi:hypothetical protein